MAASKYPGYPGPRASLRGTSPNGQRKNVLAKAGPRWRMGPTMGL